MPVMGQRKAGLGKAYPVQVLVGVEGSVMVAPPHFAGSCPAWQSQQMVALVWLKHKTKPRKTRQMADLVC